MLVLNELSSGYGKIVAVQGVSMTVAQGKIATIIGSNGSGKSTILKTIVGLVRPLNGNITFQDKRIDGLPPYKIVRKGISMVLEGRQIFPELTVRENMIVGTYSRLGKFNLEESYEEVFEIFPVIKNRMNQAGGTLSGGEQQMLSIGRALMSNPKLLLLDEPSLGLAPFMVKEIFKVMNKINQRGVTILIVEQNVRMAFSVAEYGFVLDTGRIVLKDNCISLAGNELVQRSFLG